MYKVYGDYKSGNCYKVKLMLNLLGIPYQWVDVDILKGDTQTAEFLAKNPNGKIPVLELEDGTCLWESNAILNFLADGSEFLPTEPRLRTQVLQWQFFEQYSHEPYIAVARFIQLYLGHARGSPRRIQNHPQGRLQGVEGHGAPTAKHAVPGGRAVFDCGYCAVCLHPRGA